MNDPIDRQAAIDAIGILLEQSEDDEHDKIWNNAIRGSINVVKHHLPSAQPYTEAEIQKMQDLYQAEIDKAFELGQEDARSEIIHCGDCKYYHASYCEVWSRFGTIQTRENGFCYMAERKEGETDESD